MKLSNVSSQYGAPMGRRSSGNLDIDAGRVSLARVPIDRGGYVSGGAYWGIGAPLWCAMDQDGACQYFRAKSRDAAKGLLRAAFGSEIRFYR